MSEEEKEAIDILQNEIADVVVGEFCKKCNGCEANQECYYQVAIDNVISLIEKQQEEIERLKNAEEYSKLGKETLLDTIHKQKEEIKELNKEFALNTEIHKRDEEIKELKDTIKCLHEPAENYISKDKIRDKILELIGIKGELEEKDFGIGFTLDDYYKEITIKIKSYKELLEEN